MYHRAQPISSKRGVVCETWLGLRLQKLVRPDVKDCLPTINNLCGISQLCKTLGTVIKNFGKLCGAEACEVCQANTVAIDLHYVALNPCELLQTLNTTLNRSWGAEKGLDWLKSNVALGLIVGDLVTYRNSRAFCFAV